MSESRLDFKKKRIRAFFLHFKSISKDIDKSEVVLDEIEQTGLEYIQMKLPLEKITKEFEAELGEKVEKNILHAKIRLASETDLESIMYIYNRSWLTSNTPFSRISVGSLKNIYDYPDTAILIAKVYGSDAAFIILDFEGPNNEYGVIAGLGVLPRFQRKGLGTVIGMAAWNFFKEKKGVKELRCEVFTENLSSYNFISSLGFEEFNRKIYKSEDFAD
ncbi:MAG: GNAT family N-acetyltransferase [Promethearchaeota archaeon]